MGGSRAINQTEADQALRLVAEGKTLSEIATIVGRSYSGLHRALTETWPDEYADAKQRRDDVVRNRVWNMGMQNIDLATARWALDHLIKWHLPEGRGSQHVEVDVKGSVGISHEARLTLAHVVGLAERLGLGAGARGQLPAASEILAEPVEGERTAGALPPPR